ncbi:hypothetical protein FE257_003484 [Aspergillus nanangensis]|uniref:Myb-like DNA-binding domain-containing protein n=1 Tax=Aspergillus nanangensis TaxID=2582783 RepID=A0AAD4CBJ8_ASPNN|nr:hypothetical protein FE257_003484 [Aspergillus nanangensis]
MAPKAKPGANVMFLYLCLRSTNAEGTAPIDFGAVAAATGLNVAAARMRYSRLKKVLDAQMVDGKVNLTKVGLDEQQPGESSEAPSAAPSPAKPRGQKRKKTQKAAKNEDAVEDEE